MEWQREEEYEGAKRVHVDVVVTALQVKVDPVGVAVTVGISVGYEGRRLLLIPLHLPEVQDDFLQHEDQEEADSYDEFWKRKAALFKTNVESKQFAGSQRN